VKGKSTLAFAWNLRVSPSKGKVRDSISIESRHNVLAQTRFLQMLCSTCQSVIEDMGPRVSDPQEWLAASTFEHDWIARSTHWSRANGVQAKSIKAE
jgi:hypothetical protein